MKNAKCKVQNWGYLMPLAVNIDFAMLIVSSVAYSVAFSGVITS